jgi:DNA polymerase V
MAFYIDYSTRIYNIYLKYISKEDIIVYSIDEVFCDITSYLKTYKMTPMELVTKIINDVYKETGITATAGIGTNLYLAKIAMDIVAKHAKPDKNGARIAYLDEELYRKQLWGLKPLTKFWRVGPGIANRLAKYGIMTMGDIARTSIKNEDFLYKLFGINAELLIDHAWGYEPCTIDYIKQYRPSNSSLSSGQVLHVPYDYKKAKIVLREMADSLSLDLVEKHLVTDQVILNIGYDVTNLEHKYEGDITVDHYGRKVPKPAHGSINLKYKTSSSKAIIEAVCSLYDEIVNPKLLIRKLTIAVNNLKDEKEATNQKVYEQFDLFSNMVEEDSNLQNEISDLENENKIQHVLIDIKKKYGKNAILKGTSLEEGATARDRNKQIGGHRQ